MVRLVFRPYTQVWRSICTSESLRTSTRVSSGFVLLRHSSPSFGSQRVRSCSASPTGAVETGRRCAPRCRDKTTAGIPPARGRPGDIGERTPRARRPPFHFHCASGFRRAPWLAHMLDSLVRVSRRAGWVADRFATDPEPPRRWHTPRYASSLRRTRSGRTVAPVRPCRDVRGEPGTPVFRRGTAVPRSPRQAGRKRTARL